jgi:predicted AAA+ superfamily ATPase
MHNCTPEVYFWRTSTGEEVDFVVDTGAMLAPIAEL